MKIAYDGIAALYARDRALHSEVLRDLLTYSDITDGSCVLEVGCGTGNYSNAVRSAVGCVTYALDPSAQMLSFAQERTQHIHLYQAAAEAPCIRSSSLALIFSVDVIHHVAARAEYISEAYRALQVGEKLCTVTDSAWIIRKRQPLSTYFPESVDKELARYPRISELRHMMAAAGFQNLAENRVEVRYELTDLQPYQDKAFSALHLISEQAYEEGIGRMQADLRSGPIPCVTRYLLLWGAK